MVGGSTNENKSKLSSGEDDKLRVHCFSAVFLIQTERERGKSRAREHLFMGEQGEL